MEDLVRALQRIPETQREALVLRELEGRSSKEIAAILGVSLTALQALLFRARRSLTEELENLVTCDRAELALSQQMDGRLGRKERKRFVAHLDEPVSPLARSYNSSPWSSYPTQTCQKCWRSG